MPKSDASLGRSAIAIMLECNLLSVKKGSFTLLVRQSPRQKKVVKCLGAGLARRQAYVKSCSSLVVQCQKDFDKLCAAGSVGALSVCASLSRRFLC